MCSWKVKVKCHRRDKYGYDTAMTWQTTTDEANWNEIATMNTGMSIAPSPSSCTLQLPPLQQCKRLRGTTTLCHTNGSMCNGDRQQMKNDGTTGNDGGHENGQSEQQGQQGVPCFFTFYFLSYYFTNHPPGARLHKNNTTAATPLPQLTPHSTWSDCKCTILVTKN